MKITTETIKQMIREELKEMKDPYLPTAAGTAMSGMSALRKFRDSDVDDFTVGVLAFLILGVFVPVMGYEAYNSAQMRKQTSVQISELDVSDIEVMIKDYKVGSPEMKSFSAEEISKMQPEEIERVISKDQFKMLIRNMEASKSPEQELEIQKDNTLYKESQRRKK